MVSTSPEYTRHTATGLALRPIGNMRHIGPKVELISNLVKPG